MRLSWTQFHATSRADMVRQKRQQQSDWTLTDNANDFVANFVGADRALKRLSLISCVSLANPGSVPGAPEVSADTTARDGLALMLDSRARALNLAGGGVVRLEDFFAREG